MEKAETVFDSPADEGGKDENLPSLEMSTQEDPAHEGGAEAINNIERAPNDAAVNHPNTSTSREVGLGVDKEVFVDGADDGGDEKNEEKLLKTEPSGEGVMMCR